MKRSIVTERDRRVLRWNCYSVIANLESREKRENSKSDDSVMPFSGSSDDGAATLKLLFQEGPQNNIVEQVVICPKLQDLLFFMHAFLTAKVASADPTFMPKSAAATPSGSTATPSSPPQSSTPTLLS